MTELLYLDDAYAQECTAIVQEIDNQAIVLDKTLFYASGGGQPSDAGYLEHNGIKYLVVRLSRKNGDVVHHIEQEGQTEGESEGEKEDEKKEECAFKIGDEVRVVIDWNRRYKLMRSHTAAHLLSAVIHKETGALITGNQKQEDKTRVDFNLDKVDKDEAERYVDQSNELIKKGLPVKTYSLPLEAAFKIPSLFRLKNVLPKDLKELHVVEIEDIDIQACGGTHIKNLSEIKKMNFLELKNKGKENRRIYFSLADE